jgi:hypothetical protein
LRLSTDSTSVGRKRELGEPVAVKALFVGKKIEQLKLFDISAQSESEI